MGAGKKKIRVEFRKNRSKAPRSNDFTRSDTEDAVTGERVRAKGDLSRRRTIVTDDTENPIVNADTLSGRVVKIHGLFSYVELDDGSIRKCSVRRVLKTLAMDERNIVTTGDRVRITLAPDEEGVIERVEPRHGVLTRASRNREHVLVANVDQLAIVVSLLQPELKIHLIDRYLACAIRGELSPVLCLNKVDLIEPEAVADLVAFYEQIGVPALLTSPVSGEGIERLRGLLKDRVTVFSGQSGVGKSSLLNAVQPGLGLKVRDVSDSNSKGRHTTTTAEFFRLEGGGWIVDTPGVRQLQLWDTRPEEVEGYFPEFAPFIEKCKFPDCTHTHEAGCGVKDALEQGLLQEHRYISYLGMFKGLEE